MITKNNYYLKVPSAFNTKAQTEFYKKSLLVDQLMFDSVMDPTEDEICADEFHQKKYLNQNEIYTFHQLLWVIAYCIDLNQKQHRKMLYQWLQDYYDYFKQLEIFLNFLNQLKQQVLNNPTTKQIKLRLDFENKAEEKVLQNDRVMQNQELARQKVTVKLTKLFNSYAFETIEQCPRLVEKLNPNQLELLSDPFKVNGSGLTRYESFRRRLDVQGIQVLTRTPTQHLIYQAVSHWQTKPDWKKTSVSKMRQLEKECDPHFRKLNNAINTSYLPNFTKLKQEEKNQLADMFEDPALANALQFPGPEKLSQLKRSLNYHISNQGGAEDRILKSCAHQFVKKKIEETSLGWGWLNIIFSSKIFNLTSEVQKAKRQQCITKLVGCHVEDFNKLSVEQKQLWSEQMMVDEIVKYWDDIQTDGLGGEPLFVGAINVNVLLAKLLQSPNQQDSLLQITDTVFGDINSEIWQKLPVQKLFEFAAKSKFPHVKDHLVEQLMRKINESGNHWKMLDLKELLGVIVSDNNLQKNNIFSFRRLVEQKDPSFLEKILECYDEVKADENSPLKDFIINIFFVNAGDPKVLSEHEKNIITGMCDKILQFQPDNKLIDAYQALKTQLGLHYFSMCSRAEKLSAYYYTISNRYDKAINISDPRVSAYIGKSFIADMVPIESPADPLTPDMHLIKPLLPAQLTHKKTTPAQNTPTVTEAKLVTPVTAVKKNVYSGKTPQANAITNLTPSQNTTVTETKLVTPVTVVKKNLYSGKTPQTNPATKRTPFSPLRSN